MFIIMWSYVQNNEHHIKILKDTRCLDTVKDKDWDAKEVPGITIRLRIEDTAEVWAIESKTFK